MDVLEEGRIGQYKQGEYRVFLLHLLTGVNLLVECVP